MDSQSLGEKDAPSSQTQPIIRTATETSSKMSLVHAPPVTSIVVCKQSVEADAKDVLVMENATTKAVFGDVDVPRTIEMCVCRSLYNADNKLVAFLAVENYPNVPALRNNNWENWSRDYYRLEFCSPWNSLFVHYLVWDPRYTNFFGLFLRGLYKNDVHLEHFMIVVPPGQVIFPEVASFFVPKYSRAAGTQGARDAQVVYYNARASVVKKLIIRRASEEDNIDVQPLLACQYDILKDVFGNFRLSSVIDLKDENKSVLVAEKTSEVTVGVMTVTTIVDYQFMNEFFHVPIHETFKPDVSVDMSKTTLRNTEWMVGLSTEEEDLKSLATGVLSAETDEMSEEGSLESEPEEERSMSEVLLDDDDSEFRIVDPAMEYLMPRSKTDRLRSSSVMEYTSVTSEVSVDSDMYYGRPSWSVTPVDHDRRPTGTTRRDQAKLRMTTTPYTGPENFIKITLLALHPDLDCRYAYDLVEAAFACYQAHHYCLMTLPTYYQGSPISRYFIRLTPKLSRDFPHEKYITSRNAIFSEYTVRLLSVVDYYNVVDYLRSMSLGRRIKRDIDRIIFAENTYKMSAYVLECEDDVVGLAVVCEDFTLLQMQPHYRLEELMTLKHYRHDRHGLMKHAVISPIHLRAAPFFLRQVLHLSDLETLSFCMMPSDIKSKTEITLSMVLWEMYPVWPRVDIQYDLAALDIYTPHDYVVRQELEFALFMVTQKLLSVPKVELNYRIVVVGASDTALSFLENLIFGSTKRHIRYNNLTLVSIHGLPLELKQHATGDKMLPHSGVYTRDYLTRLSLQSHVNILYGVMNVINRQEKMICLNDQRWLRYDFLFLFTGKQFCKPLNVSSHHQPTDPEDDQGLEEPPAQNWQTRECGDNMFLVNTTTDTTIALFRLKQIVMARKAGKIVVYGNSLEIYCCVESLLEFGVPGQRIVLMERLDTYNINGLTNSTIERAVHDAMRKAGVIIHRGYVLANWIVQHNIVNKLMFRSEANAPLSFDCLAFFCFGNKLTSAKTYKALADAGIVYNDGIIIDCQFRTNDPCVFAAGPGTKYSGRYRATTANHMYFSSIEVGKQASKIFRGLVEPQDTSLPHGSQEALVEQHVVPELKEPVTLVANLPGGWNYFRMSAPGRPMPLECQLQGQGDSGEVLITGDPIEETGPGYFQLTLNIYNTVMEITCLSKQEIPYHNLRRLYNKHERLLNNLLEHFNLNLIPDLYAYFGQPWAYAIYTTNFDQLKDQCADLFVEDEDAGVCAPEDQTDGHRLPHMLRQRLSLDDQERISRQYQMSSVPLYVQHITMKYISDHKLQLPMYLTADILDSVRRRYTVSPLHKGKKSLSLSRQE